MHNNNFFFTLSYNLDNKKKAFYIHKLYQTSPMLNQKVKDAVKLLPLYEL